MACKKITHILWYEVDHEVWLLNSASHSSVPGKKISFETHNYLK